MMRKGKKDDLGALILEKEPGPKCFVRTGALIGEGSLIRRGKRNLPMQRLPQFDLAGYPLHAVQYGSNRGSSSSKDSGYRACLEWLRPGACQHGVAVHA